MRKILVSVLSVAGLLAVVLALASSPATAAKKVVRVTTDSRVGTYTVSWETGGGCDPGSGTSGAEGQLALTVSKDLASEIGLGNLLDEGNTETGSISVDDKCTYEWRASFTSAAPASAGTICPAWFYGDTTDPDELDGGDADIDGDEYPTISVNPDVNLAVSPVAPVADATPVLVEGATVADGPCTQGARVTVRIADGSLRTVVVDGEKVVVTDGASRGAIQNSVFTVTAVPKEVPPGVPPHKDCITVSGEAEFARGNPNGAPSTGVQVKLDVLTQPLGTSKYCHYDVTADLLDGFAAAGYTNEGVVYSQAALINVATCEGDDLDTPDVTETDFEFSCDNPGDNLVAISDGSASLSLELTVATRDVYLVQNVEGDADGADATYGLSAPSYCPADLPDALGKRTAGGIQMSTVVELREGRYNITGAINDDGVAPRLARDEDAEPCMVNVKVSNLPAGCSAQDPTNKVSANLVDDAVRIRGDGTSGDVVLEFTITCSEPMDDTVDDTMEEPAMEEPAMEEPAMEEPAMEEPAMEEPAGPPADNPAG